MYFAEDWSPRRRILTGYYFWILKAAAWMMEPCVILDYFLDLQCQDTLITELPQRWYSHSFQFANFSCRFSTRGVKLVLQIDVHASCKLQLGLEVDSCR